MSFTPRLSAPSYTDKNWISTKYGGYNPGIVINKSSGSVLANCVSYAWGREREILGKDPEIHIYNANAWYSTVTAYPKSPTVPKIGAVICWGSNTSTNKYGHVMVVERIYDNGDILCSGSNYSGTRFYTMRITKKSGYVPWRGYWLQGFIYCYEGDEDMLKNFRIGSMTKGDLNTVKKSLDEGSIGYGVDQVSETRYYVCTNEMSSGDAEKIKKLATDLLINCEEWTPKGRAKIGKASSGDLKQITNKLDSLSIGYEIQDGYVITKSMSSGDYKSMKAFCDNIGGIGWVPYFEPYQPIEEQKPAEQDKPSKDTADLENKIATLTAEKEALKVKYDELQKKYDQLANDKAALFDENQKLLNEISATKAERDTFRKALAAVKAAIGSLV